MQAYCRVAIWLPLYSVVLFRQPGIRLAWHGNARNRGGEGALRPRLSCCQDASREIGGTGYSTACYRTDEGRAFLREFRLRIACMKCGAISTVFHETRSSHIRLYGR